MYKISLNINRTTNILYRALEEAVFWGCCAICLNCFKAEATSATVLLALWSGLEPLHKFTTSLATKGLNKTLRKYSSKHKHKRVHAKSRTSINPWKRNDSENKENLHYSIKMNGWSSSLFSWKISPMFLPSCRNTHQSSEELEKVMEISAFNLCCQSISCLPNVTHECFHHSIEHGKCSLFLKYMYIMAFNFYW